MKSRQDRIFDLIKKNFQTEVVEIVDESHLHSGPRTESHFKMLIVSDDFKKYEGRVDRQRAVLEIFKSEFENGLHALSLRLRTVSEHEKKKSLGFKSPDCSSKSR